MSHISFSELKYWVKCPHYHKVNYIDKVSTFEGNLFTAFGKALHFVCEQVVQGKVEQSQAGLLFKQTFLDEVEALPDHEELDQELFESMIPQGEELAKHAIPALDEYFGKFKLVGVEDYLYENIEKRDLDIGNRKFKGFRVTSGPKKTNNALNLLHRAVYNIDKENFIKNRLSCGRCELYKTEHCT